MIEMEINLSLSFVVFLEFVLHLLRNVLRLCVTLPTFKIAFLESRLFAGCVGRFKSLSSFFVSRISG